MKVYFKIQVKNAVDGGYFDPGKIYEIKDKDRIAKIIANGWGEEVKEVKENVQVQEAKAPVPRTRKAKK